MEPVLRVEVDALDETEIRFFLFTPRSAVRDKLSRLKFSLNRRETVFMFKMHN